MSSGRIVVRIFVSDVFSSVAIKKNSIKIGNGRINYVPHDGVYHPTIFTNKGSFRLQRHCY